MKINNKVGRLVNKKITDLKEFQGELKELSKDSYERLKASFIKHDNIAPIFIWKDNILDGHQRIKTLLEMKTEGFDIPDKIPCVEIKAKNKKEAKRCLLQYVSQHGKVTEEGLYEFIHSADLVDDLEDLKLELDLPAIDMVKFEEGYFLDTQDDGSDDVPIVPVKARSKTGDLYELGGHRVLCGDATKKADVDRVMNGNKADMVFTDPPYGVDYQSNMRVKTRKFDVLKNDDKILDGFIELMFQSVNGFVFIWTTWKVIDKWIKVLPTPTNMIIWDKGGGGIGDLKKTFSTDYEMAFVYHNGHELKGKRIGSVWEIGKDSSMSYKHPTQKPVALAEVAINSCTEKQNSILDVFLGSGSTLIACEKTKRKCYGMEIDPGYIDVIVQRYVDYTGTRDIKLNGKKIKWEDI